MPDATAVLAIAFFSAAFLYSSVGHAGASGYLAAMAFLGVAPAEMKPTALVLNLVVATIATVQFASAGHFSLRLLWPFAAGSIPMAFVGGALTLPGQGYRTLVGLLLWMAASRLLTESTRSHASVAQKPVPVGLAIFAGAFIGLLSGLTGTGGGIFLSPLLLFARRAETRESGGVSAAFILVNSAAGLAGNLKSLQALPTALPLWILAVVIGGFVGSTLGSRRIATPAFRRLLALVLLVAGGKLIFL